VRGFREQRDLARKILARTACYYAARAPHWALRSPTYASLAANQITQRHGIDFAPKLPHKLCGEYIRTDAKVSLNGRVLGAQEWEANLASWLPGRAEREFVRRTLSVRHWIALLPTGINDQPLINRSSSNTCGVTRTQDEDAGRRAQEG
jgi:hypothetical protein